MRDRLIELLLSISCWGSDCDERGCGKCGKIGLLTYDIETLADYLLENGVIVPPVNVGDMVYYINENPFSLWVKPNTICEADVVRIVTTKLGTSLVIQIHNEFGSAEIPNIKDFGETVFLTREEAEKKLKQRKEDEGK